MNETIPEIDETPQKSYNNCEKQLEQCNQELYEVKRQLGISQTLVSELEDENRILSSQFEQQKLKYERIVQESKDKSNEDKINFARQINNLEKELNDKTIELEQLKNRLITMEVKTVDDTTDDNHLFDENRNLKEIVEELQHKLIYLDEHQKAQEKKYRELELINSAYRCENDNLKEILDCKKTELDEINKIFEDLQDSYACTKAELDTLKANRQDFNKQGNSLFAEVNDKRVQLQNNVKILKDKLIEMKHERQSFLQQITLLRNENSNLITKHKEELNQINRDEHEMSSSYLKQIETLKQLIENYRNDLIEKRDNAIDSFANFSYFDKLMETKNKEIEDLRQQLMLNRFDHTRLRQELMGATRRIIEMGKEMSKFVNEIETLKLQREVSVEQQINDNTLVLEETVVNRTINSTIMS